MLVESLSFSAWPGLWGSVPTWGVVSGQRTGRRVLPSMKLRIAGIYRAAGSPKVLSISDSEVEVTLGTSANMDTG